MNKYIKLALVAISLFFTSCSDDDNENNYSPPTATSGLYVVNQGSYYYNIASSLSFLSYSTGELTDSIFLKANKVTPGNTLQGGAIAGNEMFLIANESNILFVCDKNTLKIKKTLPTTSPRNIKEKDGYIYISNYGGYVSKYSTKTLEFMDSVKVGPNPEEMAISGDYLYVTNSDGLNYLNNYNNGKSVSKIYLKTFKVEKTISVGLNPTRATADDLGNVFIIAMGDYTTIPSTIQKIDPNDHVTDVAEANMMWMDGHNLYAINSVTDWQTYATINSYFILDSQSEKITKNFIVEGPKYPNSIAIDPTTKHIFITSYGVGQWGADYNGRGNLTEYDTDGKFIKNYTIGVSPCNIFFN